MNMNFPSQQIIRQQHQNPQPALVIPIRFAAIAVAPNQRYRLQGFAPQSDRLIAALESVMTRFGLHWEYQRQPDRWGEYITIHMQLSSRQQITDIRQAIQSIGGIVNEMQTQYEIRRPDNAPPRWELERPTPCVGCRHYYGKTHGRQLLICAMHPFGYPDSSCPDWEGS